MMIKGSLLVTGYRFHEVISAILSYSKIDHYLIINLNYVEEEILLVARSRMGWQLGFI